MEEMRLEVDCYSGRTADERPVRFRLDGHEYIVEEVLDQWYGPSVKHEGAALLPRHLRVEAWMG